MELLYTLGFVLFIAIVAYLDWRVWKWEDEAERGFERLLRKPLDR